MLNNLFSLVSFHFLCMHFNIYLLRCIVAADMSLIQCSFRISTTCCPIQSACLSQCNKHSHTNTRTYANDLVQIPRNLCRFVYIKYAHMLSERETLHIIISMASCCLAVAALLPCRCPFFSVCHLTLLSCKKKNIHALVIHKHSKKFQQPFFSSFFRFFYFWRSFFRSFLRLNGFAVNYVENVVQM